jgi:glutamate/aspartate transport system substrate-binding protein
MTFSKLLLPLIITGLFCSTGNAQELTGTLKKIKNTKNITIGVRDSSIPFSYLDDKQSYQGYSIDLCMKTAITLQKKLGMSTLNVTLSPITSSTRIPLMANGTIDLECGSTTNNLERQNQVAFAPTTFVTSTKLLSKKVSGVKSLSDLKGKQIVSTSGTSNIKLLTILNGQQELGMNILTAKDHAEAFLMVETGRAVAFGMDDILLSSLAAGSKVPSDYTITADALSVEPYAIMMRKNDPEFKKAVDEAIINIFKSGEINRIYAKWFQSPIPPKGINLNIPMSPQLKLAIDQPTDSGDPATYAKVPESQKSALWKK